MIAASLALLLPLISSLFAFCFSFSQRKIIVGYICSIIVLIAFCLSFYCALLGQELIISFGSWMSVVNIDLELKVDSVSVTMMCVVNFVAAMVHFYSIFYMEEDSGFNKFFSFLGLFVFSMLILVMSNNFLLMFVGWEGVGLCSWMLIGFWYTNDKYSFAANEAFIMNRITDFSMLLGMFLIYINFGSLNFDTVFKDAASHQDILSLVAILLFVGAMGKSAQFPFHTWLADAMAGPTPVSALIHAATMVTAGVYLVIRANAIFALTPDVSYFIACLGTFVALFAASMAIVARDLKRIVAFSTLSQLGYMFVAAGLGAYSIALFHLVTHAFFKSLLFLGSGNVMHAMNNKLDIKYMGGLYKPMKITAIFMTLGSLALSGIYPFAGFFSKDKILDFAILNSHPFLYAILLLTAFLTAFYSFRLLMLVFFTKTRHEDHPHEAKKIALFAMAPLTILAVIAGFFEESFFALLSSKLEIFHMHEAILVAISLCTAFSGVFFAIFAYRKNIFKESIEKRSIFKLLANEYYIAKFYEIAFIRPYERLSKLLYKVDLFIVDGLILTLSRFFTECSRELALKNSLLNMLYLFVAAMCAWLLFIKVF